METFGKIEQKQINGTANFFSYDNFYNFVNFIESSTSIRLIYIIPFKNSLKRYLRDVNIQMLDKSEKKTNGIISEPIVFDCLSLWYEENTAIYTIEPQTDEIRWDFTWDSKFKEYNVRNLQYKNKGHVEAPILVEISGAVNNPKIEVYVEEELYQQLTISTAIAEYEKLLYGTRENEFYIQRLKTDGTKEDLYDLDIIDFYNDNIIRLPKNLNCEIRLVADNTIQNAKIIILPQYKTV